MLAALIIAVVLIFIGIPLFYSIGFSVLAYFLLEAKLSLIHVIALRISNGINVYVFIAVPLFMLSGEIMMKTGLQVIGSYLRIRNPPSITRSLPVMKSDTSEER